MLIKQSAEGYLASYKQFYENYLKGNLPGSDRQIQKRELHFQQLIDYNLHFLEHKFGSLVRRQIEKGELDVLESLAINRALCVEFFGQELFDVLQKKDAGKLTAIHQVREKEAMQGRFAFARSVIAGKNHIAIVAIRPELMHVPELVKNFLYANDFDILYSKKRIFTPAEFFAIYKDMIDEYPDYYKLFPTIILIYANKPLEILFVKKTVDVSSGETLPKHISSRYKGMTGKPEKYIMEENTIRTGIVYKEYVLAQRLFGKNLELALDPVRMIKNSIQGLDTGIQLTPIITSDSYIPYLVKAQAGIHVPTSLGIAQYMALSFTKEELLTIRSLI